LTKANAIKKENEVGRYKVQEGEEEKAGIREKKIQIFTGTIIQRLRRERIRIGVTNQKLLCLKYCKKWGNV